MFLKMWGWDYLPAEGAKNSNEVFLSIEEALITPLDTKPDWLHIADLNINKFTVVASWRDGKWTSDDEELTELIEKLFIAINYSDEDEDEEEWEELQLIQQEENIKLSSICQSFLDQLALKDTYAGTPFSFYENLVKKHAEELSKLE